MKKNIYLVRHAKSSGNTRPGWGNNPVVAEGMTQINNLIKYIEINKKELNIRHIYSSDVHRALETCKRVSTYLNIDYELCPQFRAPNNGELGKLSNNEVDKLYPNVHYYTLDFDEPYPGGESPHQFFDRVSLAWNEFIIKISNLNGNILLFTHSSVIRVIYSIVNDLFYDNKINSNIPECQLLCIEYDNFKLMCNFKI